MCGIFGYYDGRGGADPGLVESLQTSLVHRGPDAAGFFHSPCLSMGMRRLSIIDLEGGGQPLFNETKDVAVICNGEIYNYRELRGALEKKGHNFRTQSDVEVIPHLYEDQGEEFVQSLNGMFAVALWDLKQKKLILARDPLGIKPLYYTQSMGKVAFASEIKTLLGLPFVSRELDPRALWEYFQLLYITAPKTIFKSVRHLPPGNLMTVQDGRLEEKIYYDLPRRLQKNSGMGTAALLSELDSLLRDSVKLQLRSDVPVGVSLSGGLDSSLLTMYAVEASSRPISTFSAGFVEEENDELPDARRVAEKFGTRHHEIKVSWQEGLNLLPQLIWFMDQPLGDSAMIPSFLISRAAREHVKVLLGGAGGDELTAGYPRHHHNPAWGILARRCPGLLGELISRAPKPAGVRSNKLFKLSEYLRHKDFFLSSSSVFSGGVILNLLDGMKDHGGEEAELFRERGRFFASDEVNRRCFLDLSFYLPDDILMLLDRTTMGVSLEGRVPLLDHRIVELCMSIPGAVKGEGTGAKFLFKKLLEGKVPPEILTKKKRGFSAPLNLWQGAGLFEKTRRLFLSGGASHSIWNRKAVLEFLDRQTKGPESAQQTWMLLVMETWLRVFDSKNVAAKPDFTLEDLIR